MDTTFLTLGFFLIGIGFLLLLGELFVTSGVMLVLAVASIAVGLVFLFKYDTMIGIYALVGVLIALPVTGVLLLRMLPNTPLGQLARQAPEEPAAALPHFQEMQALRGRTGKTLTALRPAGMVDFDGRRVDCLTEGMMVEAGKWVRCVDVRAGSVIVRPADGPMSFEVDTAELD
jgi:membrane-bound serine protease (ClpP class)